MFTTNNKFLNLGGTFIDLENFGVTHQFLNWIFTVEAIATMDLNSISCVLICSITSKELEIYYIMYRLYNMAHMGHFYKEFLCLPWQ